jgi:subtilisin family serine protease
MSIVEVSADADVEAVAAELARDPAVAVAEPNYRRAPAATIPNDPLFSDQWGLRNNGQPHPVYDAPPDFRSGRDDADADVHEAWDTTQGRPRVVVAVIDSGVDWGHPDLAANIWTNPGETPNNGVDDDGNGKVDDVRGWDFAGNDNNPRGQRGEDGFSHGTFVAGIVAARGDNGRGISGVCPRCRIMPLRFGFDVRSAVKSIEYAIENGADIIQTSYGGGPWSELERRAIQRAGRAGILFVAAAGNDRLDNDLFLINPDGFRSPFFPASYELPTMLAVAASNDRDQYGYGSGCARDFSRWLCTFTNWGHESVDLVAPGVDVVSTLPRSRSGAARYAPGNGTSFAAPHASGAAGLLVTRHSGWGPQELKNALMNSVDTPHSLDELGSMSPGGDRRGRFVRTDGRLNARRALNASTAKRFAPTDGTIAGARKISRERTGEVDWPQDVNDVYERRLRRNRRYRVRLTSFRDGVDLDVLVTRPGTKDIWQLQPGCFGNNPGPCPYVKFSQGTTPAGDEQVTFRAGRAGTFRFMVTAYGGRSGYRLRIRKL